MSPSQETLEIGTIQEQLGARYQGVDAETRALHLSLLQSVQAPEDLKVHISEQSPNLWNVTISTYDWFGALSLMAGLFASYGLDIKSVDAFTLHLPRPKPPASTPRFRRRRSFRRTPAPKQTLPDSKILDVFEVSSNQGLSAEFWQGFERELTGLFQSLSQDRERESFDKIVDKMSQLSRDVGRVEANLMPVVVEVSDDPESDCTILAVRSTDSPEYLFALTTALSIRGFNIERAEIRTTGHEVSDTFWITEKNGRKIERTNRIEELRATTALIKQFTNLLPLSPDPAQALRQFNALTHQILSRPEWTDELNELESPEVLQRLAEMFGVSQFLWEDFLRMQHENLFPVLLDTPALESHKTKEQLRKAYAQQIQGLPSHDNKTKGLNEFKDREMFRIDLRHITGRISILEFENELTDLAEVIVEEAASLAYAELEDKFGTPTLEDGSSCPWSISALGKFGGGELGYGSDIELLFTYKGEGNTNGLESINNSRFFGDFVRSFIATIQVHREGIFELDLRLRPFGNKGPMASSLEAFKEYYSREGQARQFERMALVKLRPVAGDTGLGDEVLQARDLFVYSSRPVDIDEVVRIRERQVDELVPKGEVSAKHSHGGLVDVEYYVQTHQIMAGAENEKIRVPNTFKAIEELSASGYLEQSKAMELANTYQFLRQLIDGLRIVRGNAKDLTIPATETREFAYLAHRLKFDSPGQLQKAISSNMAYAQSLWPAKLSQE